MAKLYNITFAFTGFTIRFRYMHYASLCINDLAIIINEKSIK